MTKKLLQRVAVGAFIVIAVLGAAHILSSAKPPAPPPLPRPNGYDDLVKAGRFLTADASDYRELDAANLSALVSSNAESLRLLRIGLSRECRVPPSQSNEAFRNHLPQMASFKKLALVLLAEGRLAEIDGQSSNAARSCLDVIRLGHESARGGLVVDSMSGRVIEAVGMAGLGRLANGLSSPECHQVARAVEVIDLKSEPLSDVLKQDRIFVRRAYSWPSQLLGILAFRQRAQEQKDFVMKYHGRQRQRRLLLVAVAARAYELDQGQPPKSVADLVPEYLNAVPRDPVTGAPLALAPSQGSP